MSVTTFIAKVGLEMAVGCGYFVQRSNVVRKTVPLATTFNGKESRFSSWSQVRGQQITIGAADRRLQRHPNKHVSGWHVFDVWSWTGRCRVCRVGQGPPKILVGWAPMHLA